MTNEDKAAETLSAFQTYNERVSGAYAELNSCVILGEGLDRTKDILGRIKGLQASLGIDDEDMAFFHRNGLNAIFGRVTESHEPAFPTIDDDRLPYLRCLLDIADDRIVKALCETKRFILIISKCTNDGLSAKVISDDRFIRHGILGHVAKTLGESNMLSNDEKRFIKDTPSLQEALADFFIKTSDTDGTVSAQALHFKNTDDLFPDMDVLTENFMRKCEALFTQGLHDFIFMTSVPENLEKEAFAYNRMSTRFNGDAERTMTDDSAARAVRAHSTSNIGRNMLLLSYFSEFSPPFPEALDHEKSEHLLDTLNALESARAAFFSENATIAGEISNNKTRNIGRLIFPEESSLLSSLKSRLESRVLLGAERKTFSDRPSI